MMQDFKIDLTIWKNEAAPLQYSGTFGDDCKKQMDKIVKLLPTLTRMVVEKVENNTQLPVLVKTLDQVTENQKQLRAWACKFGVQRDTSRNRKSM